MTRLFNLLVTWLYRTLPLFLLFGCGSLNTPAESLSTGVVSGHKIDCNLTNSQFRQLQKTNRLDLRLDYKRSKDTIKFEIVKYKFDSKRFKDSLEVIKQMYSDSLKSVVKINTSDNRAKKTEIRQDKRTERTQARQKSVWLFVLVALVIGFILGFISKLRLF